MNTVVAGNANETITMIVIDKLENAGDKRRLLLISQDIKAIIDKTEEKVASSLFHGWGLKRELEQKLIDKKKEYQYATEAIYRLH